VERHSRIDGDRTHRHGAADFSGPRGDLRSRDPSSQHTGDGKEHRLAEHPRSSFLALASYAIDFAGGWLGARRFGATRWGVLGAAAGGILGLFFGLPGLLLGPLLGALTGEIIGGKQLVPAGRAGWGHC
jgi:hypothetical protein